MTDALKPLLSGAALRLVYEHTDALEAMAHSKQDKLLANGLRMLLLNHEKRFEALKGKANGC